MNSIITGLSHAAIRSSDILSSAQWYNDVLGLPEAFRMLGADGLPATIYLYIAPGEYLEIFSNGKRKADKGSDIIGLCHICLQTKDIHAAYKAVEASGALLDSPIKVGGSQCLLFWTHDPDGNEVEIMEMPPESLQAQADKRFSALKQDE